MFKKLCQLVTVSFLSLFNATIFADPVLTHIVFTCPCTCDLTRSNAIISGKGSELIETQYVSAYFNSDPIPIDAPNSFDNYRVTQVAYDSVRGQVSCSYANSDPAEESFVLSYTMVNGDGGIVNSQSPSTISILLPIGLKKLGI